MQMNETDTFNSYRAYLFAIAYRMLGSAMDAEDMVQETYLRWQNRSDADISSPKSYLAAVITRLCIDYLRSARIQRETYVGEWLPEPLLTASGPTQENVMVMADSLSMALLRLLETLTPTERAAFLLREVFDYSYAEIAEIVDKSEAACRQMVSRAKKQIRQERLRFHPSSVQQEQIAAEFFAACLQGDMNGLLQLLADDVVHYSDGGGKVSAAIYPLAGADRVAQLVLEIVKKAPPGLRTRPVMANGQPAIVGILNGRVIVAMVIEVGDGRIQHIYTIVNPDKLQHLQRSIQSSNQLTDTK